MQTFDYRPAVLHLMDKKCWSNFSMAVRLGIEKDDLESWLKGGVHDAIDVKVKKFLSPDDLNVTTVPAPVAAPKREHRVTEFPDGFTVIKPMPKIWLRIANDNAISVPKSFCEMFKAVTVAINERSKQVFIKGATNESAVSIKVQANGQLLFPEMVKAMRSCGASDSTRYPLESFADGWIVKLEAAS